MSEQTMVRMSKDTKNKLLVIKANNNLISIDAVVNYILADNKRKEDQINRLLSNVNTSNNYR